MAGLTRRDRDALTRALHAARRGDSKAARELYLRLRGKSAKEVLAILDEVGARYAKEVAEEVTAQVMSAHGIGARAVVEQALRTLRRQKLPPGLADRAERWLRKRIRDASYRVSPLTGARTAMVSSEGTVWLSRALHGANSTRAIGRLRSAIISAVKNGETAVSLAQRMRDQVGHRVAMAPPAELVQMERAALQAIRASGDPRVGPELGRMRRAFARYRDDLQAGKLGSKAAAREALSGIERAVRRGSAQAVDDAVQWFAWNKEQLHQRLIARTETARAYNAAYMEGSRAVPWVSGWTWVSDGESCEECSALDGTFIPRSGGGPTPPLHPNCDCWLEEVVDYDMQPTADEWEATLAASAA